MTTPALSILTLWILGLAGWVTNIVNVIGTLTGLAKLGDIPPMTVLEFIGIFIAPLGSILGIVSWFA